MNERFDPSLQHKISKQKFIENTTAGGASFEDTRSQFTQDAFKNEKPEQTQQDIEEVKRQLERSYLSNNNVNNDERMRQALSRFKNQQVEGGYFSNSTSTMDNFSFSNPEITEEVKTTSVEKTENKISDPVEMMRVAYQEKKATETTPTKSSIEEKQNGLTKQLRTLEKLLERGKQENDEETIELAEMQISELKKILQENNVAVPREEKNEQKITQEVEPTQEESATEQEQAPEKVIEEKIADEQNEIVSSPEIFPPSEETLYKLQEMGIKYEDLIQVVPDFATMSEGQQAYILYKTEEQSVDKIKDLSEQRFQAEKKSSGWFTRNFRQGKLKREAIRVAANDYRGLQSFSEDIAGLTSRIKENNNEIVIEDNGNYRIEYAKVPLGLDEKDPFRIRVENYNRSATALSDVPYEWSLPTASKAERRIFEKALKEFNLHEKSIMEVRDKIGENHGDILMDMHILRTKVEGDQLLSSYPDAEKQVTSMKEINWKKDWENKISNAFSKDNAGKLTILSSGSIARMISRSLYGFSGAIGASAIIGGFLGYRKKNEQFNKDAKEARKGGETKDTTSSVFDAKNTTKRINHLVSQLENETDPIKREAVLQTLDNRLQILDQRIKQGRVNFGKTKDQLSNKNELVSAMTLALVKRYEIGKMGQVSERAGQFLQKQDKKTKVERRKERVKGVVVGAMFGAGAAAATFIIADWFKGDEAAKAIKAAVDINPEVNPIPIKIPNPTDFEVSVDASSRGHIQTVVDLREKIKLQYPDISKAPTGIQTFMEESKDPTRWSMDKNLFVPGQTNESGITIKGGQLGINKAGEIIYTDSNTGIDNLTKGKFDGGHFDYDAYSETKATPENVGSGTVGESAVKPEGAENIFDTPKPGFVEVKPGVTQHLNLNNNIGVDFKVVESGGKLSIEFDGTPENGDFDKFDTYHKTYLKAGEQAEGDLKMYLNQMIMRDRILQEGNLDPNSPIYKLIARERDGLENIINRSFGGNRDIIYSFDGKMSLDPNFGTGAESAGSGQGVESQPDNVAATENINTSEVKTVRVRNNVIGQDFDFRFTKTPEGSLMYSTEGIDPNKIPNQYIEQRLGFNPDWRKASGLPLSFEDQATYGRIVGNINKIKIALAGLDSFAPNTPEHQAFKSILNTMIKMTENDYPEIFNYQTN